ncbi:hypothetical protein Tco_0126790 [Tanacetum coccineum]
MPPKRTSAAAARAASAAARDASAIARAIAAVAAAVPITAAAVEQLIKAREDPNRDGERGFDYLTFSLISSKAHREGGRASRGGFPYW